MITRKGGRWGDKPSGGGRRERGRESKMTDKVRGFIIYKNSQWFGFGKGEIFTIGWLTRGMSRMTRALLLWIIGP